MAKFPAWAFAVLFNMSRIDSGGWVKGSPTHSAICALSSIVLEILSSRNGSN